MKFLYKIMAKKMVKAAVQLLIAFLAARGIDTQLTQMGIGVDWSLFEQELTVLLFVLLEGARNLLKVKFGVKGL